MIQYILCLATILCSEIYVQGHRDRRSFDDLNPECDVLEITTPPEYSYTYLEDYGLEYAAEGYMLFRVKARNDVHVTLSTRQGDWLEDSIEVLIGGWYNTRSAIRACHQCEPVVQKYHNPLDENFFLPFWVSWSANEIRVGEGTDVFEDEFLRWDDPGPYAVNYIGISTGWGAEGHWIFGIVNGGWSVWTSWADCTVSCGGGTHQRTRACNNPVPSYGSNCEGEFLQTQDCGLLPCPVDGAWSTWSSWTRCSLTCGQGQRSRMRTCDDPPPQNSGNECPEQAMEFVDCMDRDCAVNGAWSSWQAWGECSQTCGDGTQERIRACDDPAPQHGGMECPGAADQQQTCNQGSCAVAGGWSSWTEWGACSLTCGQGQSTRSRRCDNPPPQFGGATCQGEDTDLDICIYFDCPVDGLWSSWTSWGSCSSTCGYGTQERRRACDNPAPQNGGHSCSGEAEETQTCLEDYCAVSGGWSSWGEWGDCSVSCGDGLQTRMRNCDNPPPLNGGEFCAGSVQDQKPCSQGSCPVSGGWGSWSAWDDCSQTCGTGTTSRTRLCDSPPPAFEGATCGGDVEEVTSCQISSCPVSGGWSSWASWTACSVSCGLGYSARWRPCDDPPPENGGYDCSGVGLEIRDCSETSCAVNGGWSEWSPWTQCSLTCSEGVSTRARWCTFPAPGSGGLNCLIDGEEVDYDLDVEEEPCLETYCPVNGAWASWEPWTECSVSCEGGTRERHRNCSDPVPQFGGRDCFGPARENDSCNVQDCPELIQWTPWTSWTACTVSCNTGVRYRDRVCEGFELEPESNYTCPGENRQNISCNIFTCPVPVWPHGMPDTKEAPNAITIGIVQFVILGILLGLFFILDTFTVYHHLKYAKQNISDFIYTCKERRRGKKLTKEMGTDFAAAYATDADTDTEQKTPLCDGDGAMDTPASEKRTASDSEAISDSGSSRTTPRALRASEKRRLRSLSTSSDASAIGVAAAPVKQRKHRKIRQKIASKMSIGMIVTRNRNEPKKKKKKKRPRRVTLVPPIRSESISEAGRGSRDFSSPPADIIEEEPGELALYDVADAKPPRGQSSIEEAASDATGVSSSTSVEEVKVKVKPVVRKTSKGSKKKKKPAKRKASSGKGKAHPKKRPAHPTTKQTTDSSRKARRATAMRMNNLNADDDSQQDLELGASAASEQIRRQALSRDAASMPSTSRYRGDINDSANIDITRNFDADMKDTMTLKAKTFREKLAGIRLRKHGMSQRMDVSFARSTAPHEAAYMTGAKKQNAEVQRALHAKQLNIPYTIPESDAAASPIDGSMETIPRDPATLGATAASPYQGTVQTETAMEGQENIPKFDHKTNILSKVSLKGMKRRMHKLHLPNLHMPRFLRRSTTSGEPVMVQGPTEIRDDGMQSTAAIEAENAANNRSLGNVPGTSTLQFLQSEFAGQAVASDKPAITPEDLQRMYEVQLPGPSNLAHHRGYIPPSDRYLATIHHTNVMGNQGRVPLKSWQTRGLLQPETVKQKIAISEGEYGTSDAGRSQEKFGLELDLTMSEGATSESPWQLRPTESAVISSAGDQPDVSPEENDQVTPMERKELFKFRPGQNSEGDRYKSTARKPQLPSDLEEKYSVEGTPDELSSPSDPSSDGSTRQLTFSGQSGASFLRRIPGVSKVQKLFSLDRHGERMCYSVEEGRLEEASNQQTCPSRLAAVVGSAIPRFHFRRPVPRSQDTLDIPVEGEVRSGPSLLRKLMLPCHQKRYSLDDTCVETIAKDLLEESAQTGQPIYSGSNRESASEYSSYYRNPLPTI